MIRSLAAFLMLLPPLAAAAQNDDANFKDYQALTRQLRSYGIEPAAVAWRDVNAMCLGFKTAYEQVTYNRCRLDKAIQQISYRDDAGVCDDEAHALYPDSLRTRATTTIATYRTDGDRLTTITPPTPARADLIVGRRVAFDHCMHDKGWRNSRNWQLGLIH